MKLPERINAVYYGAAAMDIDEVRSSSSGGIASVFARGFVRDGGIVFGAAFAPFPFVKHICVEDEATILRLKGSKYVESDIKVALKEAREQLDDGKKVLFIGLPCQIAALYGILGGDRENLFTVDLICHGKSPQRLFLHWISVLEREVGGKIVDYWFRNKRGCDWNDRDTFTHYCKCADGRELKIPRKLNWYGRYFLGNSSFMEGCYRCPYAKVPRIADITLGDFWGAEKNAALAKFVKNGISLVSVQSAKGARLIESSCDIAEFVAVDVQFALTANTQLNHASKRPIYRNFIFKYVYGPDVIRKTCDTLLFGLGAVFRKMREWSRLK